MWFRRKKEPVRKKRKPREWTFPKENLEDVLRLYDDMMSSSYCVGSVVVLKRLLPRYLFWQKVTEILPDTHGLSIKVEETGDWQCIKLVEKVADDDYEPEPTEITKTVIGSIETIARFVEQV